jgi:hypothetical protein
MGLTYHLSRCHLARGEVLTTPLTTVEIDKTRPSDLPKWIVLFSQFQARAFDSCSIRVATPVRQEYVKSLMGNTGFALVAP